MLPSENSGSSPLGSGIAAGEVNGQKPGAR